MYFAEQDREALELQQMALHTRIETQVAVRNKARTRLGGGRRWRCRATSHTLDLARAACQERRQWEDVLRVLQDTCLREATVLAKWRKRNLALQVRACRTLETFRLARALTTRSLARAQDVLSALVVRRRYAKRLVTENAGVFCARARPFSRSAALTHRA